MRIDVYMCICVMHSCTDSLRSSHHDEVRRSSELHCKMHRGASGTISSSAEDYQLSKLAEGASDP